MSGFNRQMEAFRHAYLRERLPMDMRPFWNRYQRRRMRETYIPQFKAAKDRKGLLRILFETAYLTFYWRCLPFHYFRYGLYGREYDMDRILDYLPETVFYYRVLPLVNTENVLLDDKSLCYDLLRAHHLPVPRLRFWVRGNRVHDADDNVIPSDGDFSEALSRIGDERTLVGKKNECGSGGHDILFFTVSGGLLLLDGLAVSFEELCGRFDGWLFQDAVVNKPEMKQVYPYSLNTLRVFAFYRGPDVCVPYMMLKFGNNYARTDNAHTGGMYVNIDMETGAAASIAYDEDFHTFDRHPLTGASFSGVSVEVDSILDVVKRASALFPQLKCIGWDVAETPEGPVIIEGNSSPGLTIVQRTNQGMRSFISVLDGCCPDILHGRRR